MRVQLLLARTDGTTRKWKFGHYWLQYSTSITSPTGLRSTVNSISIVSTLSPQDVRTCFVIGNSGHLRLQPSFFAPSREEYSSGIRLAIRRKQLRPLAAKCKHEDSELLWKKIENEETKRAWTSRQQKQRRNNMPKRTNSTSTQWQNNTLIQQVHPCTQQLHTDNECQ